MLYRKLFFVALLAVCFSQHSNTQTFQNPILPGMNPDPSICRAGDDYYLITSTFEYFPGIPIYKSKDLVHWKMIGYALNTNTLLKVFTCASSGGIFAPTIRYHDSTFYIVVTNYCDGGTMYVTAKKPEGPWSGPYYLNDYNLDPSFTFADDTVYFNVNVGGERGTIQQKFLNRTTRQLTGTYKILWAGTGGVWPEGPHLYKINGKYYITNAEGGTGPQHKQTIARSDSAFGPFEANPDNPILTHSNRAGHVIQNLGHADFVETPDGWWAVMLGVRRVGTLNHLGRETFLAPVTWKENGWPVIGNNGWIELTMDAPNLPQHVWEPDPIRDEFDSTGLRLPWNFIRNPYAADWSLTARPGYLRLNGSAFTLNNQNSPAFVGRRQTAFRCLMSAKVEFTPTKANEEAGIVIRADDRNHYDFVITMRDGKRVALLRSVIGAVGKELASVEVSDEPIVLTIKATEQQYYFLYKTASTEYTVLGQASTGSWSISGNWFTGNYVGMYASGNGSKNTNPADFDWFDYDTTLTAANFKVPTLTIASTRLSINPAANSTRTFNLATDTTWTITSSEPWLTVSPNSGANNATITLTAEENPADTARMAIVTVKGTGLLPRTIVIVQIPSSPQLSVSSTEINLGDTLNSAAIIEVTSNTGWNFPSQTFVWLSINPLTGVNNGEVTIKATQANTSASTRSVNVSLSGMGVVAKSIKVTQLAKGATPVVEKQNDIPKFFHLSQNYPNPFNPVTTITFELPNSAFVSLKVFNLLGEQVDELAGKEFPAGVHPVSFDASRLASGMYFYKIQAGEFSAVKKMVLQK